MADPRDPLTEIEKLIYGHDAVRDPVTGRVFEQGLHSSPRDVQAAGFAREAAAAADRPKEGERDEISGRSFEVGSGSPGKAAQRAQFAREANPTQAKVDNARASAVETAAEVAHLAAEEAESLAALANPFDPFVADPIVIPTKH
jgi:hypothetical protein